MPRLPSCFAFEDKSTTLSTSIAQSIRIGTSNNCCIATRYTIHIGMIVSFRHKGLETFYSTGSTRGIQAAHASKLRRILGLLDVADGPQALNVPSFKLHRLKGDLAGHWSVWVNGNWRVTFRFTEGGAELVDYRDYH